MDAKKLRLHIALWLTLFLGDELRELAPDEEDHLRKLVTRDVRETN
jgi:hypothetical protein